MKKEAKMNKKFENFIILSSMLFLLYIIAYGFLAMSVRGEDTFGFSIIILIGMTILFGCGFILVIVLSFVLKPINKNDKKWIRIVSIILLIIELYIIFFWIWWIFIQFVAGALHSPLICKTILHPEASDICVRTVSVAIKSPAGCALITDNERDMHNPPRDLCYWRVAEQTGDISLCEKMEVRGTRGFYDMCVMAVAKKTGDEQYCGYMPKEGGGRFEKEYCIYGVAVQTNNKVLCEEAGKYKDYCISRLE
jgi:hypothetical protein